MKKVPNWRVVDIFQWRQLGWEYMRLLQCNHDVFDMIRCAHIFN